MNPRLNTKLRCTSVALTTCLAVAGLLGCSESRESLHELDHVTPLHWPNDLEDAATKIWSRHELLTQTKPLPADQLQDVCSELRELIEWVPEVAADTNLLEAEWLPIYLASEKLRKQTLDTRTASKLRTEIVQLCELLRASHANLEQAALAAAKMAGDIVTEESEMPTSEPSATNNREEN